MIPHRRCRRSEPAAPVPGCWRMPAFRHPAVVGALGVPGQWWDGLGDLSRLGSDFPPLPWRALAKDESQIFRHLCRVVHTPRYPSWSWGQQQHRPAWDVGLHAGGMGLCGYPQWVGIALGLSSTVGNPCPADPGAAPSSSVEQLGSSRSVPQFPHL